MPLKRKKWTEEEERTLIDKYAEMQSDGTLGRMRTREKKFRPIAAHVSASHHAANPSAYPFLWSWKDVSTKVQNMRHQYLLVKQKLLSGSSDALSLWPNFLRYKQVFGDAPLKPPPDSPAGFMVDDDPELRLGFDEADGDGDGFDYQNEPGPPPLPAKKRKKKSKRQAWDWLAAELARIREREVRLEERDAERERKLAEAELEEDRTRRAAEERRREEQQEWEERMERRRAEWRDRVEGMLTQHRADMVNIHARIIQDQQSMIGQLLSIVPQWTSPAVGHLSNANGVGDGMVNHQPAYISQMMQNLHHMNEIIPEDNRVGVDSQEDDQFIVDG